MDHVTAYQDAHRRVAGMVERYPDVPVDTCPGWRVRDVAAHLTGLASDWGSGNLDGYASELWTAVQVDDRRAVPVAELLAEWDDKAPMLDPILATPTETDLPNPLMTAFGPVPAVAWPDVIVTDIALHEHDIRGAVGEPGARDSAAVLIAMRSHVSLLRLVGTGMGLPVLRIEPTDHDKSYLVGRGEPAAVVRASLFDLFRTTGGRRSQGQIDALDWAGEADQWRRHIVMPSYQAPAEPIIE
jgi:uncharacterized protein (TIGR03083 family)